MARRRDEGVELALRYNGSHLRHVQRNLYQIPLTNYVGQPFHPDAEGFVNDQNLARPVYKDENGRLYTDRAVGGLQLLRPLARRFIDD